MASVRLLKQLIWLYFWLVIFEGALRKWILPGLATPLLLVRDPVVLLALILSLSSGKLKINSYLAVTAFIALAAPILALTVGHGNAIVTAFGWRANFLHLPFIFIIGRVFTGEDVKTMGRCFMFLSIPMTLLMIAQFYSPAGSLVNIGVGGEGDAGFDGAMGYRRPPGVFSFTNGISSFYPLVTAFALAEMMQVKKGGNLLPILAGLATLASLPISISRSNLLGVLLVLLGCIVAMTRSGRSLRRLLRTGVMLAVIITLGSLMPGMEKPREAFLSRWNASTTDRGGFEEAIVMRVVDGLTAGLTEPTENWISGAGLGMGTNAGAKLLTGNQTFLISEAEWGRLTGEMGMPLGLLFIFIRVALTLALFLGAWRAAKRREPLGFILWFAVAMNLMQGQWGQPTALGFATLGAGLTLAAIRSSRPPIRAQRDDPLSRQAPDPSLAEIPEARIHT